MVGPGGVRGSAGPRGLCGTIRSPAASISAACTDYSAGLAAAAVLRPGLPPKVVTLVNEGNAFVGLVCGLGDNSGSFQEALRAWTLAGGAA